MTKARKVDVAKAIEIYAELECNEIIGYEELDAFGASDCGDLIIKSYEAERILVEKEAGVTVDELVKLCNEIGFSYHRVFEKVLDAKLSKYSRLF